MIVLDASVVVEVLTNPSFAGWLRGILTNGAGPFIVPHLLDVEVLSAVRRIEAKNHIGSREVDRILAELTQFPAERLPHTPLLPRVWELRHNFTAYDATYIALAEQTGATLYTTDAKLRTGHRASVEILTR